MRYGLLLLATVLLSSPVLAESPDVNALALQLRDPDITRRIEAVGLLGQATRRQRYAAELLVAAMRHEHVMLRFYAADAAGELDAGAIARREVIAPALLRLLEDPEWLVMRKAVLVLGKLKISAREYARTMRNQHRAQVVELAVDLAREDRDAALYYLNALGAFPVEHEAKIQLRLQYAQRFGPFMAVMPRPALVARLLDCDVRYTKFLLEKIPDSEKVIELAEMLAAGDEKAASEMLVDLRVRKIPYFTSALSSVLRNAEGELREFAIYRIKMRRHNDAAAQRYLLASLDKRHNSRVRADALDTLAFLGIQALLRPRLARMDEEDPDFRLTQNAYARRYRKVLKDLTPVEQVIFLLNEDLRYTQPVLESIDGVHPVVDLIDALDRGAFAQAIEMINQDEIPFFLAAVATRMQKSRGRLRDAVIDRMLRERQTHVIAQDFFAASLEDSRAATRGLAKLAIEELGLEAKLRPLLAEQLASDTPEIAAAAIRRLHALGSVDEASLNVIRERLRDDNEAVQLAAARTVAEHASDPAVAVDVLAELLKSKDKTTRLAAIAHLQALGSKARAAASKLAAATHDADQRIADAALDAYLAVRPERR